MQTSSSFRTMMTQRYCDKTWRIISRRIRWATKCRPWIRINKWARWPVHKHISKSLAKLRRLVNCKTRQPSEGSSPVRFSEMMKLTPTLIPMFRPMIIGMIDRISMCRSGAIRSEQAKRVRWDIMDSGKLLTILRQTKSKKTNNS